MTLDDPLELRRQLRVFFDVSPGFACRSATSNGPTRSQSRRQGRTPYEVFTRVSSGNALSNISHKGGKARSVGPDLGDARCQVIAASAQPLYRSVLSETPS